MQKIKFKKSELNFLATLAAKLYEKGYFNFIESGEKYVDYIFSEIYQINNKTHYTASKQTKKYGDVLHCN